MLAPYLFLPCRMSLSLSLSSCPIREGDRCYDSAAAGAGIYSIRSRPIAFRWSFAEEHSSFFSWWK